MQRSPYAPQLHRHNLTQNSRSRYYARVAIYYEWYEITRHNGRERRRKLRWRMTVPSMIEHGLLAENMGKVYEAVPGSAEDRGESNPPYIGWGQALPDVSIEAAKEMGDRWTSKRRGE